MRFQQKKEIQCLQFVVMGLIFCFISLLNTQNAYGQFSYVECDINGDRIVDIVDVILGLQVLSGVPVANLIVSGGGQVDLQKTVYALQVQAGGRDNEDQLVDWDGDGFNAVSGDCDETDINVNPGQSEICGDDIDNNCDGKIDEGCSETTQTPTRANVAISALGFDFVFDSVVAGGDTTVKVLESVPDPPAGFLWTDKYFDVSTTAQVTGSVEVCINYDDTGMSAEEEAGLQIFHYDQATDQWHDITTIPADTQTDRVCSESSDFSPFAMGVSSLVGKWTVWMDYYCNGSDYSLPWEFHAVDILPDYAGVTDYRTVTPDGQLGFGTWAWNSIGSTYTVNYQGINIPGTVSENSISGQYTTYAGEVYYAGVRQ